MVPSQSSRRSYTMRYDGRTTHSTYAPRVNVSCAEGRIEKLSLRSQQNAMRAWTAIYIYIKYR